MEMWLRPTTVVLLTVAVMVLPAPGELILHVVPKEMSLSVGSCVTLSCCANKSNKCWVQWWFNPSESSLDGAIHMTDSNCSGQSTEIQQQQQCPRGEKNEQNCAVPLGEYTILNAQKNHSGWYFCKVTVDIPVLEVIASEGANIIVTKSLKENTTYPSLTTIGEQEPPGSFMHLNWWIWIILGVSCLIVVVLLITCTLKRNCTRTEVEDPIYTNTRPKCQPSPRPRMPVENMKAASSHQNTHTPNFGRTCDNDRWRYKE